MIHRLVEHARRKGLEAEPGFGPKDVRWAVVCDDGGRLLEVVELGNTSDKRNRGQAFGRCPDLRPSEVISGGIARSHFLTETAEVVALYGEKGKEAKTRAKHDYFVRILGEAAHEVGALAPVAKCVADEGNLAAIRERLTVHKAKATEKVMVRTPDLCPLESDVWHDWWRLHRAKEYGAAKAAARGRRGHASGAVDFVTGEAVTPAATHPKITGLAGVGGQPSGDVLIGFDKEAYGSYGFEQSANAAMSEESASAYRAGLNDLIRNNSRRLAGVLVVHWFSRAIPRENDPLVWLETGFEAEEAEAQARAREFLDSLRTGRLTELRDAEYYAMALSGAAGRVMVRDWMEGRFEDLAESIAGWFDDFDITRRDGSGPARPPKFFSILSATVRDPKDLPMPFVTKMWRTALRGEPIPREAAAQALARIRVDVIGDAPANHARMGLIKAFLIRNARKGGGIMSEVLKPTLSETHPSAAYQCGRLMALFAALQRRALGDVGAGVVQRYYAAASATPALVLGRLARTSQHHLNKLDAGLARWFEGRIADVWSRMGATVPRTLDLEEQSLFALGYYQQIAEMRARKVVSEDGKGNDNE